ncbi:MAG: RNA polymerase factor sigma-54 [Cytophagales bacterium]|nr:RNA polymerase factor sigma-54 [Cytophagales bacterium]
MQKLTLSQSLHQKLSPQQIQFIKLLQVPTVELEGRVEEEMEINPALEEGKEDSNEVEEYEEREDSDDKTLENLEDYYQDDYAGYKMQGDKRSPDEEDRERPITVGNTLHESLMSQLGFLRLDEHQHQIGLQLVGSIESDGYIRRSLSAIVNDLAFSQNVETDEEELEEILFKIQDFDPAGIAARDLQECLQLQLDRKEGDEANLLARKIIEVSFEEFSKKHYDKIMKRIGVEDEELFKVAIQVITRLNPKPGGSSEEIVKNQYIIPDFFLKNNDGEFELTLNGRNAPELRVSQSYSDMFKAYDHSDKKDKKLKETVTFIKQKLDSAKWFIDAIKQRQNTLMRTMQTILDFQEAYFQEGDENKLKPMILKDIAERIDMDISTVSRVANSKSIQTDFGTFPLKYFFSEGIATDSGEDVSSREVKNKLKDAIEKEDKNKPLSDDKLEQILRGMGYNIARRTVAKYREQLNIPVARLRKQLS